MTTNHWPISGRIMAGGLLILAVLWIDTHAALAQLRIPRSRPEITLSFAPLVRRAGPAVVNIEVERVSTRAVVRSPIFDDPFFRQFFGDAGRPQIRESQSVGSGVIVGADGLIVTNHHVIEGAERITVILSDRREFNANIVRDDARTDLAVLQIDIGSEELPFIRLSDSEDLEVGELVLAIGNPFGVGQTVTSGIVSALARTNRGISDFSFFIQTDAAINPGNSGGALLRMDGTLAGVNTAIFSQTGGSQGIGFAIPANMVRTVIESVGAVGGLQRPWLGARGRTVTAEIAAEIGLERPVGVLIAENFPGGPAERGGLLPGDVIISLDSRPVDDAVALNFRLATTELGGEAILAVMRDGREIEIFFPVESPTQDPAPDTTLLGDRTPLAGATVANLSPALADQIGVDLFAEGVVVLEVDEGSIAQRLNINALDFVRDVNGVEIIDVRSLRGALSSQPGVWNVTLERDGRILQFSVSA